MRIVDLYMIIKDIISNGHIILIRNDNGDFLTMFPLQIENDNGYNLLCENIANHKIDCIKIFKGLTLIKKIELWYLN